MVRPEVTTDMVLLLCRLSAECQCEGSLSAKPLKTAIRSNRSRCCACATSGHLAEYDELAPSCARLEQRPYHAVELTKSGVMHCSILAHPTSARGHSRRC